MGAQSDVWAFWGDSKGAVATAPLWAARRKLPVDCWAARAAGSGPPFPELPPQPPRPRLAASYTVGPAGGRCAPAAAPVVPAPAGGATNLGGGAEALAWRAAATVAVITAREPPWPTALAPFYRAPRPRPAQPTLCKPGALAMLREAGGCRGTPPGCRGVSRREERGAVKVLQPPPPPGVSCPLQAWGSVQPAAPVSESVLLRGSPLPSSPPQPRPWLLDLVLLPPSPSLLGKQSPQLSQGLPGFTPQLLRRKTPHPEGRSSPVYPRMFPASCPAWGHYVAAAEQGRQPSSEHSTRSTEDSVAVCWDGERCGLWT